MDGWISQTQFSLLSYLDYQRGTKEVCDELGITLIAYSPLCLGLLSGKYRAARQGEDAAAPNYPPGPRGLLARQLLRGAEDAGLLPTLAEIAARRGVPESQVRVRGVWRHVRASFRLVDRVVTRALATAWGGRCRSRGACRRGRCPSRVHDRESSACRIWVRSSSSSPRTRWTRWIARRSQSRRAPCRTPWRALEDAPLGRGTSYNYCRMHTIAARANYCCRHPPAAHR